jgi:catecholate siderophore receptor
MSSRPLLLSSAIGLVIVSTATAESPARQDTVYVYGTSGAYAENDSRSSTKTDTPLVDIPQSVTVITRDLIDDQSMASMGDLVRYIPGVTMGQGEGHRDAPTFRGNATTANFFVDGARDDLQYLRDLYTVDRVDVLKGPSALAFGRGAGGGTINRVTKQADGEHVRDVTVSIGSFDHARAAVDLGNSLSPTVGLRLNAMYEDSGSYRDGVSVERGGVAPTAKFDLAPRTSLSLSAEHFEDERTVDRGVPSDGGRPFSGSQKAFFGNPDINNSDIEVNTLTAVVDHSFSGTLTLRSSLFYGDYDKFYQNTYAATPVSALGAVEIAAYNSGTKRENLFSQTDLVWKTSTGDIDHTLLAGIEFGQQVTENTRFSGSFPEAGGASRLVASVADRGLASRPVFTDLVRDNTNDLSLFAIYAQDQVELTDRLRLIAGVRYDRFDLDYQDRLGADFSRTDDFVSPRLGAVYSATEAVTLYAGWSQSYLPQSGDQFSSLDASTTSLEPELFENIEIGAKYQPKPELLLTAALYRLDRDNTRAPGAVAGTTVLTGSQRSEGLEISLQGEIRDGWHVAAAYALQSAEITQTTSSAPIGRKVALVPEQSLSVWNKFAIMQRFGAGLGVIWQDAQYASITNAVTLPSFTRVDAALYYDLTDTLGLQFNVENLLGETYWTNAHNDNNITPGAPTLAKITLSARF